MQETLYSLFTLIQNISYGSLFNKHKKLYIVRWELKVPLSKVLNPKNCSRGTTLQVTLHWPVMIKCICVGVLMEM